jgi:hypothetical protein
MTLRHTLVRCLAIALSIGAMACSQADTFLNEDPTTPPDGGSTIPIESPDAGSVEQADAGALPKPDAQTPSSLPELSGAQYEIDGDVTYITFDGGECANVVATPTVSGDYVIFPIHAKTKSCDVPGTYNSGALAYSPTTGKLYEIASGPQSEGVLLVQAKENQIFWPYVNAATAKETFRILDSESFGSIANGAGQIRASSDSSPLYLDGIYYFGTVNSPQPICQGTTGSDYEKDCGAIFGVDPQGQVVRRLDVDKGFRNWITASPVTDGTHIYTGGGAQSKGDTETEYLYGCSLLKLDKDLNIVASADPGDEGCRNLGKLKSAPAGEIALTKNGLWVQWLGPNEAGGIANISLYDHDLNTLCNASINVGTDTTVAGFYQAPTVDKDGNAYIVTNGDSSGTNRHAQLYKVDQKCNLTLLAEGEGQASVSPTLADDKYVLFPVDGKLKIITMDGKEFKSYTLASTAKVSAGPIIHKGVIYVIAEDATITAINNSGIQGYGAADWPRFRANNRGGATLK